ncbi:hypothetical protein PILCRDRAFT_81124 [Piloderma croceum F 1598]|uniref:Uncharacterized protein n=1 Tax=Piloderma croceum (strain F 1598) TaxID=765440 RepID=A0A0C3B811_PILCF|nr:hypothetical protein PILCRDRAFT_81124 [Piloderma croceum F 1598]
MSGRSESSPARRTKRPLLVPPSEAVDQAWEDLYSCGLSQIPKIQAELMVNKTIAIPGDEANYVVELNVFHLLSCLNKLRQALYPDYYNQSHISNGFDHNGHSITSIREALTRSADVTPFVWKWDEEEQRNFPRSDTLHSCRNLEKIRQWSKDHQLDGGINNDCAC